MLSLLTSGSSKFQDILREQGTDLVKEAVNFLKMFDSDLAVSYLPLVSQLVEALSAFVFDSPANKKIVVSSQLLLTVNRFLTDSFSQYDNVWLIFLMKLVDFVIVLVDEADSFVITAVTGQIDPRSTHPRPLFLSSLIIKSLSI